VCDFNKHLLKNSVNTYILFIMNEPYLFMQPLKLQTPNLVYNLSLYMNAVHIVQLTKKLNKNKHLVLGTYNTM